MGMMLTETAVLGAARVGGRCLQSLLTRRYTKNARHGTAQPRDPPARHHQPPVCPATPPFVPRPGIRPGARCAQLHPDSDPPAAVYIRDGYIAGLGRTLLLGAEKETDEVGLVGVILTKLTSDRAASLARDVLFDGSPEELQKLETAAAESEVVKPLAEELIDNLSDLLFYCNFTVPKTADGQNKVSFAIWQTGVGCTTAIGTSKEFESNRTEILRLLLTLASRSLYMSSTLLPVQGVRAITYLATCSDKQVVLSMLCSLLNTVRCSASGASNTKHRRHSNTIPHHGRYLTMYKSSRTQSNYTSPMLYR